MHIIYISKKWTLNFITPHYFVDFIWHFFFLLTKEGLMTWKEKWMRRIRPMTKNRQCYQWKPVGTIHKELFVQCHTMIISGELENFISNFYYYLFSIARLLHKEKWRKCLHQCDWYFSVYNYCLQMFCFLKDFKAFKIDCYLE